MEEDDDPYLQIDLGKQKVITAVATQGLNNPQGNWVERYSLNYSCDGINWKTYQSFAKDEVNANYKLWVVLIKSKTKSVKVTLVYQKFCGSS